MGGANAKLKALMAEYFSRFDGERKVAWCTSVGPAELLRAFGYEVYFPENHGALLGATRLAGEFIPDAIQEGYAGDICSYLTADIGAFLRKQTPLTKHYGLKEVPKPDLIVFSTNQCREVQDWFTWFGDKFDCPVFGIYPPRHLEEVDQAAIDNVAQQFRNLAAFCEEQTGTKLHPENFRETVDLSREAAMLWRKVLETAKNSPPPLSFFDGCIFMGPIVVLRGTQEAVDFYQLLLDELEEKVEKGEGIMEKENCRVFWDGMPIWGKLRMFSNLFLKHNVAVVASTYCNSWAFDEMDSENPFESTAKAYTSIFINRGEKAKAKMLIDMIREYRIDGIIFHDARTCFNNTNVRFGLPERLEEDAGIPSLVIEGDLCDLRFFSEDQTTIKVESFIDQIMDRSLATAHD